jgi:hypothetical protein
MCVADGRALNYATSFGQPAATGKEVIPAELERGVVPDVGFPADPASADERPRRDLAVATRATRPDHPSPSRAAN